VKNSDYLSRLVITTHTQDDFEFLSPRDYVDTKSCLAYEQNHYSTYWVRSCSCHRETLLGYNILLAITQQRAKKNISLLHDVTTPRYSKLGAAQPYYIKYNLELHRRHQHESIAISSAWLRIYIVPRACHHGSIIASMTQQHHHQHNSASTSSHGQVAPAALSPAKLSSIVANMTRHLHHATAKSSRQRHHQHDSAALSLAWLSIYIAPRPSHPAVPSPTWLDSIIAGMARHIHSAAAKSHRQHRRQHHRQHDWTSTSRYSQVAPAALTSTWLDSIITSMTQHLYHAPAKSPRQLHRQHDPTSLSSTWLNIYIALRPSHPGSVIVSMTR
jgi:hypothetical protein